MWTVVALLVGLYLGAVVGSLIVDAAGGDSGASQVPGLCGVLVGVSAARSVYAWRKSREPSPPE